MTDAEIKKEIKYLRKTIVDRRYKYLPTFSEENKLKQLLEVLEIRNQNGSYQKN